MKILLAHNFYNSANPSGENVVFRMESELLKTKGHRVVDFTRSSDDLIKRGAWGMVQGALLTPWNPAMLLRGKRHIAQEKPDILHVHNTFPRLSPAIFHAAKDTETATVLTLHNYRTVCAAAIPMRSTAVCTECMERRSPWPAMKYGCYRQSRMATLPLVLMIALHNRLSTWKQHVDAFIALTAFQKRQLAMAGLPEEKIFIKPQFYPDPPEPLAWKSRTSKAVYVGRLSPEKGVHILVDAWLQWQNAPVLEIIGDGPTKALLEKKVASSTQARRIHFLGQLSFERTQKKLAAASLLVLPSLCFEGFPMVLREAYALGVPVIGSRIGAIAELIREGQTGALFTPGDVDDLLARVKDLWADKGKIRQLGENARKEFAANYTADENYRQLTEIYEQAKRRRCHHRRN